MKKIIVLIVLLTMIGLVLWPQITTSLAKSAFKPVNVGKPMAPKIVYHAAKINFRSFRYAEATRLFERGLIVWPKLAQDGDIYYYLGVCYEKQNQSAKATQYYAMLINSFPDHKWKNQAQHRMDSLNSITGVN